MEELFDTGQKLKLPKKPCTPAPVGSGPEGKTCGTCVHRLRVKYHADAYWKCDLMRAGWTHGAASDIKLKWPACREFAAKLKETPDAK